MVAAATEPQTTIRARTLRFFVSALATVTSKKDPNSPPIVEFRETADGLSYIAAGDGNDVLNARIPVGLSLNGYAPARKVAEVLGALGDDEIELSIAGTQVEIEGPNYAFRLKQPYELERCGYLNWNLDGASIECKVELKGRHLYEILSALESSTSRDLHRPILTGIRFEACAADDSIILIATDTHRLTYLKIEGVKHFGLENGFQLPLKALKFLERSDVAFDDVFLIAILSDDKYRLAANDWVIEGNCIKGSYPNWQRVVPTEWTRRAVVSRSELLRAASRAGILAADSARRTRLTFHDDRCVVSARSEECGECSLTIPCTGVKLNGFEIAVNYSYLRDIVAPIAGDQIVIELTENTRPMVVKGESDSYQAVVMPMALA
jgi:DNA polymerase-3 subunit beta